MQRNRQDAHRPATMIPSDYRYLASSNASYYYDEMTGRDVKEVEFDGTDEWFTLGEPQASTCDHAISGQCDHCGAHHVYQVILLYIPTGEILSVGHTCAFERFGRKDWKNIVANAAKRTELKAQRTMNIAKALVAMNDETKAAYEWATSEECDNTVAKDIASKCREWGPLSDRQSDYLVKLHVRSIEQKVQAENEPHIPCPVGKSIITGVILSTKYVESMYGATLKMLVKSPDGFKVWGTVPSSICEQINKGCQIRFSATIEQSRDDASFGFFKRPSKAEVLAA